MGGNLLDGDVPARSKTTEQIDAFRGTVYAAVDKIARRIQQIPLKLILARTVGAERVREEVLAHPFLRLLGAGSRSRPHPEWSVRELMYWTGTSLDLTGEAWWLTERNSLGVPSRVTPVAPNRMTVVLVKETGMIGGYVYLPKGAQRQDAIFVPKLPFEDLQLPANFDIPFFVFFRYPSPHGFEDPRGWSPVKAAALAYDINLFELIYKKSFLEQGAQLGGIIQTSVTLSADQIDEYLDQFKARHRGPDKAGLPLILPPALQWHQTEPHPRDMQWVETLELTDRQILQIYGVSDAKLGRADVGNRATNDAMDATFNKEVVQSRLDFLQSKLDAEFLPIYPGQTDENHFDVEFADPVPANTELELKREEMDVQNRIRTRAEIRENRGLDPMGRYGELVEVPVLVELVDPETAQPEALDEGGDGDGDGDGGAGGTGEAAAQPEHRVVERVDDPRITRIVAMLTSREVSDRFIKGVRPVILSVLGNEAQVAFALAGGKGTMELVTIRAEWLGHLNRRIVGVNRVTASQLRLSLIQGTEAGEITADLFARVEDVFSHRLGPDVERIARTETIGASNFGAQSGYKEAGAPFKEWLTQIDGNQRTTHDKVDGKIIGIDQAWKVGSSALLYPGDPTGEAKEVINCRCSHIPAFKESKSRWTLDQREALWRTWEVRLTRGEKRLIPRVRREFRRQLLAVKEILGE